MRDDVGTATVKPARTKIRVWIDFVCPYCLLGEQLIQAAIDGLDVDVVWMPFELRPYPTPTLRPEDDYLPAAWKQGVYPAAERLGVPMRLPTISPQPYTRKAFLGLQYAVEHGQGDAYVDAVLRAFFQDDRDIGDTDVLKAIFHGFGLDPEALGWVIASPLCGERHDAALRQAQEAGIRAVPSVAVGNRLFSGMPKPEDLRAEILRHTS
ncbi:DsbA family protein [Methylobacterium sp. Leaf93]|uniref:DsbA family oxidoreductase n=1 Tax=Methylobacterium sp. Leaf93 TaxID=1736249 RepID=UPI0006F7A85A|nr:DsbA family protein [Methylobacterium sp. Leaf93]KQP02743.1 2-hydroxychromene-2-carboxylate isomerase [Methylobacterium sp. Leaf93]